MTVAYGMSLTTKSGPDAYLGILKRTEILVKRYVAKRFVEKCDFMEHAHFVLCFIFLDYSVSVWCCLADYVC